MFMYAMHDALLKPMPDNPMAPSLAISQRPVELHRRRIMQKLQAESAVALARQVVWAQGT
jgi:FixJ family two-component response regulator